MYKVKLLKDTSLPTLEKRVNEFIKNQEKINKLHVNISISNAEDSVTEYIATIIYDDSNNNLLI